MASSYSLNIGGTNVQLSRNESQIAVRANTGLTRSMTNELQTIARRLPVDRRGQLAGFEILDIQASPLEVSRARSILRNAASVRQEVPVYHTSADGVPFIPVGTIYLSFRPEVEINVQQSILDNHGLTLVGSERDGFLTVRVSDRGPDAVEVAAALQAEKDTKVAEPDLTTTKRSQNLALPDDELLQRQCLSRCARDHQDHRQSNRREP